MGRFVRGDVVLAPVRIDAKSGPKVRPCVVVSTAGSSSLIVYPVSSRPSAGTSSVPISLDDFSCGGLDLFQDSYLLISTKCRITTREIIGKKGHLLDEFVAANIRR
ncbi:MAG TPA: type II toxin-antitoxin system PemK/MazF family toxin [Methanoregulaceae archaeon]|nr:type II toxin-antitoxin system PemK/MazF family toxin [Methanoregulaceae archaeon]